MENFILIDIETGSFNVESGIYEVALMVIENGEVIKKVHFGEIEDEALINAGYGSGYYECSDNEEFKQIFKGILDKYNHPLVAHNGSFDRKFLIYYNWLDEDYPFFDSIRAIRLSNPRLFSYSMSYIIDYLGFEKYQTHTAMEDVELLFSVINHFKPTTWLQIGEQVRKSRNGANPIDFTKFNFDTIKDIFHSKTMVFTGKGFYERKYLAQLAVKCGAIVDNGVTKRTNILVVGEDSGKKLQKAIDLGCEIMDMSNFYELVHGIEIENVYKSSRPKITSDNTKIDSVDIPLIKNKKIVLACMSDSLKEKLSDIIIKFDGTPKKTFRVKDTDLLIYKSSSIEDERIEKAKINGIPYITLGEFNKIIEPYL